MDSGTQYFPDKPLGRYRQNFVLKGGWGFREVSGLRCLGLDSSMLGSGVFRVCLKT